MTRLRAMVPMITENFQNSRAVSISGLLEKGDGVDEGGRFLRRELEVGALFQDDAIGVVGFGAVGAIDGFERAQDGDGFEYGAGHFEFHSSILLHLFCGIGNSVHRSSCKTAAFSAS